MLPFTTHRRCPRAPWTAVFSCCIAWLFLPVGLHADSVSVQLEDGSHFVAHEMHSVAGDDSVIEFLLRADGIELRRKVPLRQIANLSRAPQPAAADNVESTHRPLIRQTAHRFAVPRPPLPPAPCEPHAEPWLVPPPPGRVIGVSPNPLSVYQNVSQFPVSLDQIPRTERHAVLAILREAAFAAHVPFPHVIPSPAPGTPWESISPTGHRGGWRTSARLIPRAGHRQQHNLLVQLQPAFPTTRLPHSAHLSLQLTPRRVEYHAATDLYRLSSRNPAFPMHRAEATERYRWAGRAVSDGESLTALVPLPQQFVPRSTEELVELTAKLQLSIPGEPSVEAALVVER